MNSRFAFAALGALSFLLSGCPTTVDTPDAGPDAGGEPVTGTCAETCAPYERCDEASRSCVPGCTECEPGSTACVNGCAQGFTCTAEGGSFLCVESTTSCGDAVCAAGQTACLNESNCSCLTFRAAGGDSCAAQSLYCEGLYNDVTGTGGSCRKADLYEECTTGANCGAGLACVGGLCLRGCGTMPPDVVGACGRDEQCIPQNTGPDFCYWNGIFIPDASRFEGCVGIAAAADGGFQQREDGTYVENFVPISNKCIPRAAVAGDPFTTPVEPANLVGTCVPVTLRFPDSQFNYTNCKSPGDVPKFGRCLVDDGAAAGPTTCAEGLTCVPRAGADAIVDRTDEGVCLDVCNAALPINGVMSEPTCGAQTVCMNYLRETDRTGVLGGCAKSCDVFGTAPNFGCAPETVGAETIDFACVPVPADGSALISNDGTGVCVESFDEATPLAAEGARCAVTDAFQGASCASGLVCIPETGGVTGICRKPCDLECSGESPPARCATLENETCSGGRTCTQLTPDPLARTGICQ